MTTMMVLMAGLTLGSNGAERISTETEQRLCLKDRWAGTLEGVLVFNKQEIGLFQVGLRDVKMFVVSQPQNLAWSCNTVNTVWVDEGQGKCHLTIGDFGTWRGIYKHEAGQLFICLDSTGKDRPTDFGSTKEGRSLFILKRITPSKK